MTSDQAEPDVTVMAADQYDQLMATLDQPDDAPALAAVARRPRRYSRPAVDQSTPARYRVRQADVDAICWTGDNEPACRAFADTFDVFPADEPCLDDGDATAAVRETVHNTWVLLHTGDWIVRGTTGLIFVKRAADFAKEYEPARKPMVVADSLVTIATGPPANAGPGYGAGHLAAAYEAGRRDGTMIQ